MLSRTVHYTNATIKLNKNLKNVCNIHSESYHNVCAVCEKPISREFITLMKIIFKNIKTL